MPLGGGLFGGGSGGEPIGYLVRERIGIDDSDDLGIAAGDFSIDMHGAQLQYITVTGAAATVSLVNGPGQVVVRITADGNDCTLTFPADWKWPDGFKPGSDQYEVTDGSVVELTLLSFGSSSSNVNAAIADMET